MTFIVFNKTEKILTFLDMVHINLMRSNDDFKYTLYEREFSVPLY
jgi:hypothetical protein